MNESICKRIFNPSGNSGSSPYLHTCMRTNEPPKNDENLTLKSLNIKISIRTIHKAFYSPKIPLTPHLVCQSRCRLHHNSSHCRRLAVTHSYSMRFSLHSSFFLSCVFVCITCVHFLVVKLQWQCKTSVYDHLFDVHESYHLYRSTSRYKIIYKTNNHLMWKVWVVLLLLIWLNVANCYCWTTAAF